MTKIHIHLLTKESHDRNNFDCGSEPLNLYLAHQANQDMKRRMAAVYVAIQSDAPERILGFYSLSTAQLCLSDLPPDIAQTLPRYPYLPAYRLGRLAVDLHYRGLKIGERLLIDALFKCFKNDIPGMAVLVDSKNDSASCFYKRYGFIPFSTQPSTLFMTMKTINKLFQN